MSTQKIIHSFICACLLQFGASAQNETIAFRTFYDSLSFAFGVENGTHLFTTNSKFDLLDKMALVRGFQSSIFGEPIDEGCEKSTENFLGTSGNEFNTDFLKEGSICIGSYLSFEFYAQMKQIQYLEDLNMALVLQGFKAGVFKQHEKLITTDQKDALIAKFGEIIDEDNQAEIARNDRRFWKKVLENNELHQIDETGIYVETLGQGIGGKPSADSDIETHYILTNNVGDTLESSYTYGSSLKINLGSVIAGWREGFQALELGGKYRLYIPYEKAYKDGNKQAPQGALCFFIEFIDFGPKGTLAKPQPTIKRVKH